MQTTKLIFVPVFLVLSFAAASQNKQQNKLYKLAREVPVPLYCRLDAFEHQYSGLAIFKDERTKEECILLIPESPQGKIAGILKQDITAALQAVENKDPTEVSAKVVSAKKEFYLSKSFTDSLNSIPGTPAIEGAAVTGNDIYFSVETATDLGYVVKGKIAPNKTGDYEIGWTKKMALPKPPKPKPPGAYGNAGFESIAHLSGLNRLLVVYEKNRESKETTIYTVNTSLQSDSRMPLTLTPPIPFRITDIALSADGKTLLAINHHYNDYNSRNEEFPYYIGDDTANAMKQMKGENPKNLSFTRIVKMRLSGNTLIWGREDETLISFSNDNWEGIIPFNFQGKSGVLMVIDGWPLGFPCRLSWFQLETKQK